MTLTGFLLARIAEYEAGARAAGGDAWRIEDHRYQANIIDSKEGVVVYDEGQPGPDQAEHIARHDPARVLAECEAKRRIVEEHDDGFADKCHVCRGLRGNRLPLPCPTLRALAAVYADHPDYRGEEWRP